MKKFFLLTAVLFLTFGLKAQDYPRDGQNCTSIMVGKKASMDGSVITSHTCDGVYRTWMAIEPAQDFDSKAEEKIYKGSVHTSYRTDTTGLRPTVIV